MMAEDFQPETLDPTRTLREAFEEDFILSVGQLAKDIGLEIDERTFSALEDALTWVREHSEAYKLVPKGSVEELPQVVAAFSATVYAYHTYWELTTSQDITGALSRPVAYAVGSDAWRADINKLSTYVQIDPTELDTFLAAFVYFYGEALSSRFNTFDDENVVALGGSGGGICIYKEAQHMYDTSEDEEILINVLAGLQQYRARCNLLVDPSESIRVNLLLELFNETDLITLAKAVEMQTGIRGLIKTFLQSYAWSAWELKTSAGYVGEYIPGVGVINLKITVGPNGNAKSFNIVKPTLNNKGASMTLLHNGEPNEEDDWYKGHDALPNLRVVAISTSDKKITVAGLYADATEGTLHSTFDPLTAQIEHLLYTYDAEGNMSSSDESRVSMDEMLRYDIAHAEYSFTAISKSTIDREEIKRLLRTYSLNSRALAHFLLPYCDAPTPSSTTIYYMLPS